MSFLAICLSSTFLLVGKVAVKSCLAVTQPVSCLQTVKMKMFHNSIVVSTHIPRTVCYSLTDFFFSPTNLWTPRRTDARALSYLAITLI